jgi:hypothetical protein
MWLRANRTWSSLLFSVVAVAALPALVAAQTVPTRLVERTPRYTFALEVGPPENIVSSMDAMHGMSGEVAVTTTPSQAMTMEDMDQGMAINHALSVHIGDAGTDAVVTDVIPTIRITDKATGQTRDLNMVIGTYGSDMGASDFHYGQNLSLPDGTYLVTVTVGSDTAQFRDVAVVASPMMADHGMSMSHEPSMASSHEMAMPAGTAQDGQTFSQQPAVTQALFRLVWGDRAEQEWVNQHNESLMMH